MIIEDPCQHGRSLTPKLAVVTILVKNRTPGTLDQGFYLDGFINNLNGLGRFLVFSTTSVLFDIMMIYEHGGQNGDNSHIVGVAHVMSLYLSAFGD